MNKHDHVSGRPRDYISRKWFHRGRHRDGQSVEELIDHLNGQILEANPQRRWQLSADGKHYLFSGMVAFPKVSDWDDESNNAVIMIDAPGGLANFPVQEGLGSFPVNPCQHHNKEVVNQYPQYADSNTGVMRSYDLCYSTTFCSDCGQWLNEESIYG